MKTQKENVREYYWVTDIQLGLMTGVSSHKERKKVMEEVLEKQFIGNYPTESEFKEWINRARGTSNPAKQNRLLEEAVKWQRKNPRSIEH